MRMYIALFAVVLGWGTAWQAVPAVAEPLTLRVTYGTLGYHDTYRAIADRFTAEHPDIRVELRGAENYEPLVQQTMRDAAVGQLPDVSHQGMNWIRLFVDRGFAVPLDKFIADEGGLDGLGYPASVGDMCGIAGKTYCVPFAISAPVFFYNLDLVRRAGGNPADLPDTWPEILDLAKRIDALGDGVMGVYYDVNASGALAFQALLFGEGGRMMDASEEQIAFDGHEGRAALETLRHLGRAGQVDMTREQARQAFMAGVLGMYANTNSLLTTIMKQTAGEFEVAVAPQPMAPDGRQPAAGNALVVFATDPIRQKTAWDYVKFATGPVAQTIMVKGTGYVPINLKAAEDPALLGAFYAASPNYRVALGQLPTLTRWYAFPGENAIKISDYVRDRMRAVVSLKETPEAAMAALVVRTNELLPR